MSSKGLDLVDSWEEIDEDRLASRLSKLANEDSVKPGETSTIGEIDSTGRTDSSSLSVMLEEELRPRMILQRPQMQILRRPQSTVLEEKTTAESKPKAQIKSFDQRKQEYAEARLRILGSAHDEEEQQQNQPVEQPRKSAPIPNGFRISNNPNNNNMSGQIRPQSSFRPPPGNYHIQQHPGPYYQPHSSGGGRNQLPPEPGNHHYYHHQHAPHPGPGAYTFQQQQQQQLHQQAQHHQKQQLMSFGMPPQSSSISNYHHGVPVSAYGGALSSNNNVLRMPAGPDGSHGFTMRR
ncbi:GATA zinc finger domain-containing protein 10 [Topomyia yanbarensis]|uniref:GATA zinc finger domain-containing protein 10 n=1 Tax=Topomyia yanbarensis TaxID=2498891 RepID=UPI00273CD48D|nr:GATA zinc finger domain-containing protein 10 [Topomyia yanbarensis]